MSYTRDRYNFCSVLNIVLTITIHYIYQLVCVHRTIFITTFVCIGSATVYDDIGVVTLWRFVFSKFAHVICRVCS